MILLRDVVEIRTSSEDAFDFLVNMDRHYSDWHPDHRSAAWTSGEPGREGSVLVLDETLHGKRHRLRLRITRCRPEREIRYTVFPGLRGGFLIQPSERGVRFTAELTFGWTVPVVGRVVDGILGLVLAGRLEALRLHMAEEGENLKTLLESSSRRRSPG